MEFCSLMCLNKDEESNDRGGLRADKEEEKLERRKKE
jgi:hypothetical protein